jgi:hypothetical protein
MLRYTEVPTVEIGRYEMQNVLLTYSGKAYGTICMDRNYHVNA